MPRRPLRVVSREATENDSSAEIPAGSTGRVAQSRSSFNLANSVAFDAAADATTASENQVSQPTRHGSDQTRKSIQPETGPALAPAKRAASAARDSTSSVPTPADATSGSEYSTPATSNPTPTATDIPGTLRPKSSFEVRIPSRGLDKERGLRSSRYSMRSSARSRQLQISDSNDELDNAEFSNDSPDALAARRMQRKEDRLADAQMASSSAHSSSRRTSARNKFTANTPQVQKLASVKRSGTFTGASGRPSKKPKASTDLKDDVDMDQDTEVARQLQEEEYNRDNDNDAPFSTTDVGEDSEGTDDEYNEDSEPLALTARRRRESRRNFLEPLELGEAEEQESQSSMPPSDTNDSNPGVDSDSDAESVAIVTEQRRQYRTPTSAGRGRVKRERFRLEHHHPEVTTMWSELQMIPVLRPDRAEQPRTISRMLKPFQLEGLAWMKAMERTEWKGGLLGDEMGLGKTIQAVSLIMSDYPAKQPSLVLVPPVALMQWQSEIKDYTDGTLKTFIFHGTNQKSKAMTVKDLRKFDVVMMSYNSLESMYRKQEKGFKRKDGMHKQGSVIHAIKFHRIILDEAHSIKTRSTMTAKACFALKTDYRWCLSGTPLQNRIGEFFSLIRFLNIRPFASYLCKQCPCETLEWSMGADKRCSHCHHAAMQHVSLFNQELLNPIQHYGNAGPGFRAFKKLRLLTDRIMLRRLKKDHTNSMELPVKEIYIDRQFFGEEENDFANSIMTSGQRKFDTYVAQGVMLNNYANIFGLIMQMRQVADHPDLILKKNSEGGQNVLVCCICDEPSEDTVRSRCKHDFCRACVASYVRSTETPDCPRCHIPLSIDLEQPEIEQDETLVKKTSIINRIKMDNWTSSSKIELLVHELHKLRSDNATHKSIIFSQFTTMLQLIEWRLRRAGITTVMLDGSMTPAQRQASIEHFMNNVDVECFLVSLKAGGVALNLTEASRVFIVDPWWNPAAEWQSADRCHRIGQTRPCTITRLCIEDSVESRMVLIQEKKTSMIHSTVNSDDKAMESLSPEDMQFLFRGS
ncbi:DNA repair protein RAD16 [Geosmithia morbida]|uniref:DNA repair protein RAD16 n=1 Tax=Geosmithia morbida TaxID=1094350 RepID=A0A9P5D2D1_9HYPO|nr:DNA repair protein RAD16 [Geosmithia morbida]KAF4120695.1 DNA repair protein RAD16 [Geosmithia morbida]